MWTQESHDVDDLYLLPISYDKLSIIYWEREKKLINTKEILTALPGPHKFRLRLLLKKLDYYLFKTID